jgi:predicted permease
VQKPGRPPRTAHVYPYWRSPRGVGKVLVPIVAVLWGVVALVLVIACANVAGVLLAKSVARRREVATRIAMGATRKRLIRQFLTESLVLGLIGGAASLPVAYAGARLLALLIPASNSAVSVNAELDGGTLLFSVALSLVAGVLLGVTPALRGARVDLNSVFRDESGAVVGGRGSRLRSLFVVGQLALSVVLLTAAAVLMGSLVTARRVDAGFNQRGVFVASVDLRASGYDPERGRAFIARALERLQARSDVASATVARRVPLGLGGSSRLSGFSVVSYSPAAGEVMWANSDVVGPGYFGTMQMPLVAGRDFTPSDRGDAPAVAVINQAMADKYFAGRNPVGGVVRTNGKDVRVVGVAANASMLRLHEPPVPWLFFPVLQSYRPDQSFLIRVSGDPRLFAEEFRGVLRELDPLVVPFAMKTLEAHVRSSAFAQIILVSLTGSLGLFALILAAVGMYGIMAHLVAQRRREMGVRLAMGAAPRDVFRLIVAQGLKLIGLGVAVGVLLSPLVLTALSTFLISGRSLDLVCIAGVAAVMGAIAVVACGVPARSAARLYPTAALRQG